MWGNFKKKRDGFSEIRKVLHFVSAVVFPFPSAFAQIKNTDYGGAFNSNDLVSCGESYNSFTFIRVGSKTSNYTAFRFTPGLPDSGSYVSNTHSITIPYLPIRNALSCRALSCTSRKTEIGRPATMVAIEKAEITPLATTGAGYVSKNRQITPNITFGIVYELAQELPAGNTCPVRYRHVRTNNYTNKVGSLFFVAPIGINKPMNHSRMLIEATRSERLTVSHAFVPNLDIENDVFFTGRMEQYPNSRLQIFNLWDVTVIDTNGYDNFSGGKTQYRTTITKNQLAPSGPFFSQFQSVNKNLKRTG